MRNLKRALSLALASVMLMGMMVVGSSAAGFPDVSNKDNTEAISVLNAVGVMLGDEDTGNFRPEDNVTRNEMAVILAKLILGSDADKYVGTCPFTDVPTWAQKYVAACYDNKIVAGRTESVYDGSAVVTAQEAAAMVLRVLGYEKLESTGTNWAQPVVAKANEIRLFKDVGSSATAPLNRNQVAQLSLNALKADVVVSDVEKDIVVEGVVTIPGKVIYNKVEISGEGANNYAGAGDAGLGYQQLCEKLYGTDLKLTDGAPDAMGRPGIQWSYKNDSIGTYASEADRVIVVDKAQTLAKELEDANKNWKMSWGEDETTDVRLNGGKYAGGVQVGDVVEVYMDSDTANAVGTVAITRYSMDEVTGAIATKGSGDDLQIRIPGFIGYTDADKVNGDYDALEKDDIIYYYKDNDDVYTFFKAESFEGTPTGARGSNPRKLVIDGDQYTENALYTFNEDYNAEYTFYTDANGYLIAAKEIEETSSDYVVIQEIKYAQGTGGITGSAAVEARLVRMDGTVEVIEVASVKIGSTLYSEAEQSNKLVTAAQGTTPAAVNTTVSAKANKAFFTYSINSDDEYELTEVTSSDEDISHADTLGNGNNIEQGKASIASVTNVALNRNTVFVVATENGGKEFKVYTGINEVPDITLDSTNGNGAYVAEGGVATHVYVNAYASSSVSGDYVFIIDADKTGTGSYKDGNATKYYNTYKAVVGGEYKEVEVVATNKSGALGPDVNSLAVGLFTPTYDSNDRITKLAAKSEDVAAIGYKLDAGTLLAGSKAYTCADDALVFIMDEDGNVTEGAAADLDEDANDNIYVVKTNTTDSIVDFLVIVENPGETTEEAAEEAVADIVGSIEWNVQGEHQGDEDAPYEPTGTFAVDGNTITASGYDTTNMTQGLNDTPRFLAALYKDGTGVTEIKYNGTTYTWNSDKGPASKWYNGDSSLVGAIVTDMQKKLGVTTDEDGAWVVPNTGIEAQDVVIKLTMNGVAYDYIIKVPEFPATPQQGGGDGN